MRRALDRTYGITPQRAALEALEANFGAWVERGEDGADYVEALRGGMQRRLTNT